MRRWNYHPNEYADLTVLRRDDGSAEVTITKRHAAGASTESIVIPAASAAEAGAFLGEDIPPADSEASFWVAQAAGILERDDWPAGLTELHAAAPKTADSIRATLIRALED